MVRFAGAHASRIRTTLDRARHYRRVDTRASPRKRLFDSGYHQPESDLQTGAAHDGERRGVLHAAGSNRAVDNEKPRYRRYARKIDHLCEDRTFVAICNIWLTS